MGVRDHSTVSARAPAAASRPSRYAARTNRFIATPPPRSITRGVPARQSSASPQGFHSRSTS